MDKATVIKSLEDALNLLTNVYNEVHNNDLEYDVLEAMERTQEAINQALGMEE